MLQPHPPLRWSPFWMVTVSAMGLLTGSLAVFFGVGMLSLGMPAFAGGLAALQLGLMALVVHKLGPAHAQLSSRQRTAAALLAAVVATVAVGLFLWFRHAAMANTSPAALVGFNLGQDEWQVARTALSLMGGFSIMAVVAGLGFLMTRRARTEKYQRISRSLYRQSCVGMLGVVATYVALNGRSWALIQQALA